MRFGTRPFSRSLRAAVRRRARRSTWWPRFQHQLRLALNRIPYARLIMGIIAVAHIAFLPDPTAGLIGFGAWWWLACVATRTAQNLAHLERCPGWEFAVTHPVPASLLWPFVRREQAVAFAWTTAEFATAFALLAPSGPVHQWLPPALGFGFLQAFFAQGFAWLLATTRSPAWMNPLRMIGVVAAVTFFLSLWLREQIPGLFAGLAMPAAEAFGWITPAGAVSRLTLQASTSAPATLLALGATAALFAAISAWSWRRYRAQTLAAIERQCGVLDLETLGDARAQAALSSGTIEHDPRSEEAVSAEDSDAPPRPARAAANEPAAEQVAGRLREAFESDPAAELARSPHFVARGLGGLGTRRRFLATLLWSGFASLRRQALWTVAITALGSLLLFTLRVQDEGSKALVFGGGWLWLFFIHVPLGTGAWVMARPAFGKSSWHALVPLGYFEVSRTVLRIDLLRALLAWPWLCVFSAINARALELSPLGWIVASTALTLVGIALQPLRPVFAFAARSRAGKTFLGTTLMFALVITVFGFLAVIGVTAAMAFDADHSYVPPLAAALLMVGVSFGFWAAFGWLHHRAKWDLVE